MASRIRTSTTASQDAVVWLRQNAYCLACAEEKTRDHMLKLLAPSMRRPTQVVETRGFKVFLAWSAAAALLLLAIARLA